MAEVNTVELADGNPPRPWLDILELGDPHGAEE
jgi:hypothetical protein